VTLPQKDQNVRVVVIIKDTPHLWSYSDNVHALAAIQGATEVRIYDTADEARAAHDKMIFGN
jgi:hypothetical protein